MTAKKIKSPRHEKARAVATPADHALVGRAILWSQQLTHPSVNFPTVTNVMYDNLLHSAADAVNDPIIADSEPIQPFRSLKFESLSWQRMLF